MTATLPNCKQESLAASILSPVKRCSKDRARSGSRVALFLLVTVSPALLLLTVAFAAQRSRTMVVSGHSGEVHVFEMSGRSYVEIQTLASVVHGSLSSNGSQIVLTLPVCGVGSTANAPAASQATASGFSREFLKAGIEEMSVIREWRSTLTNAVQRGFPVTEEWTARFRDRAQQNLHLASVATSTESDRNAMQLLANQFNNMKRLSDRFVEANKSRTYTPLDALKNDPLDQRILNCAHALASMAAGGQFVDDGACQ